MKPKILELIITDPNDQYSEDKAESLLNGIITAIEVKAKAEAQGLEVTRVTK